MLNPMLLDNTLKLLFGYTVSLPVSLPKTVLQFLTTLLAFCNKVLQHGLMVKTFASHDGSTNPNPVAGAPS